MAQEAILYQAALNTCARRFYIGVLGQDFFLVVIGCCERTTMSGSIARRSCGADILSGTLYHDHRCMVQEITGAADRSIKPCMGSLVVEDNDIITAKVFYKMNIFQKL
jgi:hypothetical protein